MQRTVLELQGISCMPIDDQPKPKQQIVASRSFGEKINESDDLTNKDNRHMNVFRLELKSNNIDGSHIINQNNVSEFFKCKLDRKMGDRVDSCKYLDHIEECLSAHDNMVNLCIMELKAIQKYALLN